MNVFKQALLALMLLIGGIAIAPYLFPSSSSLMSQLGVPNLFGNASTEGESGPEADSGPSAGPGGRGRRASLVTTASSQTARINDRLEAIGSGEAIKSVAVVPQVSGVLAEVLVKSGSNVSAGQTIVRLDSQTEEVALEAAKVDLVAAELKFERYAKLRASDFGTRQELEELQAAFDAAKLAVREAEVNLGYRTINAPIDGAVGIVSVEVGDYVTTETEIAVVDDRSSILINYWVTERFAGLVEVGQRIQATSFAFGNESFVGEISAIGSRIEAASRTFQLQASIDNSKDRLRPGMSFAVSMQFGGNEFPSVDPLAVQWDSEGSYVWHVSDGTANRLPIRIVERNADSILVDGALADGNEVIIEGQLGLTDGAEVKTVNASFTSTDNQLESLKSPETAPDNAVDQTDIDETES